MFQSSKTEKHSSVNQQVKKKQPALQILPSVWKMCEERQWHVPTRA
jgi:hypothetical protein